MKNVLASAMEAELGALFVNCQQGTALEEMGHHLPPTPVVTDSATSDGFVNDNIRQRKSRAIDTIFYSVRERVRRGHYLVYWERTTLPILSQNVIQPNITVPSEAHI